jgi:hypothetical protein
MLVHITTNKVLWSILMETGTLLVLEVFRDMLPHFQDILQIRLVDFTYLHLRIILLLLAILAARSLGLVIRYSGSTPKEFIHRVVLTWVILLTGSSIWLVSRLV